MHVQYMRFVITFIATLGAFAVYVSRVNLSIAIIAMVDESKHDDHSIVTTTTTSTLAPTLSYFDRKNSIDDIGDSAQTRPLSSSPLDNIEILENNRTLSALSLTLNQTRVPMRYNFPAIKDRVVPLITQTKFKWSQVDQGHIIGAFFYGYILFQIPGARIAETVGSRWIIMASSIGSTVVSLTFPMATQLNSIYLLMMLRFVMGLCQSAFFPAAYVLCCRWLPEKERSILLPGIFIGSNMGSISTYIASSYLLTSPLGWPSVFYASGLVCLVVSILWCIFGSSDPSQSVFIGDEERSYIENLINNENIANSLKKNDIHLDAFQRQQQQQFGIDRNNSIKYHPKQDINNNLATTDNDLILVTTNLMKQQSDCCSFRSQQQNHHDDKNCNQILRKYDLDSSSADELSLQQTQPIRKIVPEASWSKLIRSIPVWTLVLSMYGNEWSNVVLTYELPTYLNTALGFPIEQNGVINSFFQLAFAISSPVMSGLGAYLLEKHMFGMQKIHVRKTFQSIATFGQFLCFVSVPLYGDNRGMIIMLMFSAIIFRSCANAGDIMVPGDLSPDYAGTIFAFANSVGNTAGFFAPSLVGVFVHSARDRAQWAPFWFTTAAIMGFSGLIFLIFGKVEHQDFDKVPRPKCRSRFTSISSTYSNNKAIATIKAAASAAKDNIKINVIGGNDEYEWQGDHNQQRKNKLITKVIFK